MGAVSHVYVGFDSAWMDRPNKPGAITALLFDSDGEATFISPCLTTFAGALAFVAECSEGAEFLLVAIDQPTIVVNEAGCRPVERVAGGVVNAIKGGVQPANRSKAMFADGAPIWRFLEELRAVQNPNAARSAQSGRFCIEVFPALGLPGLIPQIWERRRAAKYNPATKHYRPEDWVLVAHGLADWAARLGLPGLSAWAERAAEQVRPRKSDQDQLDAAICLITAIGWRLGDESDFMQIGDLFTGYMVTGVSPATRAILETRSREVYRVAY